MSAESSLRDIVASVIAQESAEIRISPTQVATDALVIIDPEHVGPPLEYLSAHLHLRQLARELLRGRYEPDGVVPAEAQHELFPQLQQRYPCVRRADEEPVYVMLEHLSGVDITYNIARLRGEAQAKQRHADALERYASTRSQ